MSRSTRRFSYATRLSESACSGGVSDPPAYINPCGYEASYATINSKGRVFRPRPYTTATTYDPASESPPHTDGSHGLGLFGLSADGKQGDEPGGKAVEAEQMKFASADDAQKDRY